MFFGKKSVRIALKAIGAFFKCILTMILIGMITLSIVGSVLVVYVVTSFNDSDIPDIKSISQNESSIIYVKGSDGQYKEFMHVEGVNSIWVNLGDIPDNMQHAVIAIEDKRFYQHKGVDWIRTFGAAFNLLNPSASNTYGGSTIDQQLIKNLSGDKDQKISRKVREIFKALEMERDYYSKDQILEAYLNILPLSGNITGVGAAANYYFGKDVKNLDLAQCALIAGITQNPVKYNPYTHPDNAKQRQRTVLSQMYALGMITEDEYKQAYNEELVYSSSLRHVAKQDYYVDLLTTDVIQDLMDTYGYSKQTATMMFYYGGLHIYSAENPELEAKAQDIFATESNFPKVLSGDKENPQAGIAVIDYSGRLIVTVGGRGQKTASRVYNRSTDATRQPGSAMKPIAVYTPAIDKNLITYSTIMNDHPITLSDGTKWPYNYVKNAHYGNLPVVEALERSLNTIPAQLIEKLTPQRSFDFLTNSLHMTTLVKSRIKNGKTYTDMVPALALGGLTDGVKCIEMAAAYQIFGNGGYYNKPYTYYSVTRNNKVLLENKTNSSQVVSEDTSYVMNRLLQMVVNGSLGTAYGQKVNGNETFAKTGTTNDNKDVYFVGGTPYYVGACWFGYDNNQELEQGVQTQYAKILWRKTMDALHSGLKAKTFDKKGDTVEAYYCTETGLLATDKCPHKAIGVYKADNVPGYCTTHGGTPLNAITKNGTPSSSSTTSTTKKKENTASSQTNSTAVPTSSASSTATSASVSSSSSSVAAE